MEIIHLGPSDTSGLFTVLFPYNRSKEDHTKTGFKVTFNSLEDANIARIWAKALWQIQEQQNLWAWANLATMLNLADTYYSKENENKFITKLINLVMKEYRDGNEKITYKSFLPRNAEDINKLFEIAGYPWS